MSILCFCLDTYLPTSSFVWSPASESALFQALIKHKPAGGRWTSLVLVFKKLLFNLPGINKHFAMALVSEKLCSQLSTDQISSEEIWWKLKSMFDLNAVDDREEVIPFTLEEREFCLPRRDFNSLIVEKQKEILKVSLST